MRSTTDTEGNTRTRALAALGVLGVGAYATYVGLSMDHQPFKYWGALLCVPALLLISWPMLAAAARRWDDPWVTRLLVTGFVVKLLTSLAYYFIAFTVYGVADAASYDTHGQALAHQWWQGNFNVNTGKASIVGTGFLFIVTGAVYFLTGPSILSGFFVFSWLAFWGVYLCYRAFRLALPDFDHRRYGKLLFFMPSLLFWPSAIGKEAWMTFAIGVLALGAAKIYTRDRFGYPLLAIGAVGTAYVRPHITVLAFVGVIAAYVLRPRNRAAVFGPLWKVLGLIVLLGGGIVALNSAKSFLHIDSLTSGGIQKTLDTESSRTTIGGSAFAPTPVHSVTSLPRGVLTVLFRPYPWEAHGLLAILTGLEGVFILGLCLVSWRRLVRVPRLVFQRPYITFCIVYVFLFIYAFSSFGNFGIISRERVQALPFLFVFICLPKPERRTADPPPIVTWQARERTLVA